MTSKIIKINQKYAFLLYSCMLQKVVQNFAHFLNKVSNSTFSCHAGYPLGRISCATLLFLFKYNFFQEVEFGQILDIKKGRISSWPDILCNPIIFIQV